MLSIGFVPPKKAGQFQNEIVLATFEMWGNFETKLLVEFEMWAISFSNVGNFVLKLHLPILNLLG
jgi:hypothetical protein